MQLVPDQISEFLSFDDVVSLDDSIRSRTDSLIAHGVHETAIAKAIFEWVRDRIPHSKDISAEVVTCSAIDTYRERTGICFAKSHLLAAMMRYANIPCGFCYQVFDDIPDYDTDTLVLHGLNAILLKETRTWHRIDPRGNREGIDSQFSVDRELLAFPECAFLDDNVYAAPLTAVVNGLRNAKSLTSLWSKLPSVPRNSL
jgi:transglutaminase-like putative cysteine protease